MCDKLSQSVTLPAIAFRETGNTETLGDGFSAESRLMKYAKPRKPGPLESWHSFCNLLRITKITMALPQ